MDDKTDVYLDKQKKFALKKNIRTCTIEKFIL